MVKLDVPAPMSPRIVVALNDGSALMLAHVTGVAFPRFAKSAGLNSHQLTPSQPHTAPLTPSGPWNGDRPVVDENGTVEIAVPGAVGFAGSHVCRSLYCVVRS